MIAEWCNLAHAAAFIKLKIHGQKTAAAKTATATACAMGLHPGSPICITAGDPSVTAGLIIQWSKGDLLHLSQTVLHSMKQSKCSGR